MSRPTLWLWRSCSTSKPHSVHSGSEVPTMGLDESASAWCFFITHRLNLFLLSQQHVTNTTALSQAWKSKHQNHRMKKQCYLAQFDCVPHLHYILQKNDKIWFGISKNCWTVKIYFFSSKFCPCPLNIFAVNGFMLDLMCLQFYMGRWLASWTTSWPSPHMPSTSAPWLLSSGCLRKERRWEAPQRDITSCRSFFRWPRTQSSHMASSVTYFGKITFKLTVLYIRCVV